MAIKLFFKMDWRVLELEVIITLREAGRERREDGEEKVMGQQEG